MSTDPAIEAVRAARIEISREVGNDPARLIEHYAELQKKVRERLIRGPEQPETAAQQDVAPDGSGSSAAGPRR
jgi:hypothetical protein